ncbi:MAG: iron ABC transporter permease [bacterium]
MKDHKRYKRLLPLLIILPFVLAIVSIGIGTYYVNPIDVLKVLCNNIFQTKLEVSLVANVVVMDIRLPRIILGILVGAGLSVAGVAYQSVFSNPLTSSDTLGTSAGAGFGAALCILLGASTITTSIVAFGFGLLSVFITFLVSKTKRGKNLVMLLLSGMVVASIFSAGLSFIQLVADKDNVLPEITFWLMGSLSKASITTVLISLPIFIICMFVLYLLRWRLNVLSLNEIEAKSLGMDVKKIRIIVIVVSTFITALAVSLCGIIGWVGILVPHITRMLFGNNNRYVVPASMFVGAIVLLIMDMLARTIAVGELPLSILTAFVGGPIFIILLRKTGGVR